jgi:hypothetical protein
MSTLRIVGFDPSLRNWGVASGTLSCAGGTQTITIDHLDVIQPVLPTGKQVRQNSLDLDAAAQLTVGALRFARDAHAVFVEVPVGSQSARAMASYGVCVGILGALRALGIPFFEVTPTEVKVYATGKKTATKQDMIAWATTCHPHANWPTYSKNNQVLVSEAKAEHMADAVAAIHAGIASNPFRQQLPFLDILTRAA